MVHKETDAGPVTGLPSDGLLTVKEAAQILHVHANTVRKWANEGILQAKRLGARRDRRLSHGDVLQLLKENQIHSRLPNKSKRPVRSPQEPQLLHKAIHRF